MTLVLNVVLKSKDLLMSLYGNITMILIGIESEDLGVEER